MKFKLKMSSQSAAFYPDSNSTFFDRDELVKCLRRVAQKMECDQNYGPIKDFNGNTCGEFELTL